MLCCLQVCSAESRKLSDLFLFLMVLDVTVSMSTAPDNMLASGLHSSFLPSLTGIKSPRNMFVDACFHKRNNSGSSTDAIHSDFVTSSSYHIQSRSPTERAEQQLQLLAIIIQTIQGACNGHGRYCNLLFLYRSNAALCLVYTRGAICMGNMRGTTTLLSCRKSSLLFFFFFFC